MCVISNQNAMGGQLPRELFQDAAALDELIAVQQTQQVGEQWQEWSLLATDGDTAFLLELASEKKVRFPLPSRAFQPRIHVTTYGTVARFDLMWTRLIRSPCGGKLTGIARKRVRRPPVSQLLNC